MSRTSKHAWWAWDKWMHAKRSSTSSWSFVLHFWSLNTQITENQGHITRCCFHTDNRANWVSVSSTKLSLTQPDAPDKEHRVGPQPSTTATTCPLGGLKPNHHQEHSMRQHNKLLPATGWQLTALPPTSLPAIPSEHPAHSFPPHTTSSREVGLLCLQKQAAQGMWDGTAQQLPIFPGHSGSAGSSVCTTHCLLCCCQRQLSPHLRETYWDWGSLTAFPLAFEVLPWLTDARPYRTERKALHCAVLSTKCIILQTKARVQLLNTPLFSALVLSHKIICSLKKEKKKNITSFFPEVPTLPVSSLHYFCKQTAACSRTAIPTLGRLCFPSLAEHEAPSCFQTAAASEV